MLFARRRQRTKSRRAGRGWWVLPDFVLVFALMQAAPSLADSWAHISGSDSYDFGGNVHVVGFRQDDDLVIVSLLDHITSIVAENAAIPVSKRRINRWIDLTAVTDSHPNYPCKEYFFGLSKGAPEFEFGVISDRINGQLHIFIVANNTQGCMPAVSGTRVIYKMHNLLTNSDINDTILTFDQSSGRITLEVEN